jgi:dolichol-phosphate mannosyltransferase
MSKNLVIIPAYNEEETIYEVVTRSLMHVDVSVTDDGSKDKTAEILKSIQRECDLGKYPHKLNIITHPESAHIPKSLQDGLIYACASNYDLIVTMDAGLSHDPDALPDFFNYNPTVDVIIGSRKRIQHVPLYRRAISVIARMVVNYALTSSYFDILGPGIKDCTSGYRRYSRRAFELISKTKLKSKAFDFHMEALALCYRAGMKVEEISISYVFSNSSFNKKVLKQAIKFGIHLISTKNQSVRFS